MILAMLTFWLSGFILGLTLGRSWMRWQIALEAADPTPGPTEEKKKPLRVIVSLNDGVLYVNRVKTIEDQLDTGNRVYHCDKHLGKAKSLVELSRLLKRLGAVLEPR